MDDQEKETFLPKKDNFGKKKTVFETCVKWDKTCRDSTNLIGSEDCQHKILKMLIRAFPAHLCLFSLSLTLSLSRSVIKANINLTIAASINRIKTILRVQWVAWSSPTSSPSGYSLDPGLRDFTTRTHDSRPTRKAASPKSKMEISEVKHFSFHFFDPTNQ